MKVLYYGRNPERIIYTEDRAEFVPEKGDEVCLPPDDDPSNEYEGGWTTFEVRNRRYVLPDEKVVCYVE